MDYMYGVSTGLAVGALTVLAGSVGFALSLLSLVFNYVIPGLPEDASGIPVRPIKSLPASTSPTRHACEKSPRSSVGSFLSQTTATSSDASHPHAPHQEASTSLPPPIHPATPASTPHRVTFQENLVLPPTADMQLRLPRDRTRSAGGGGDKSRSVSPKTPMRSATDPAQSSKPAPPVASTSATRLDSNGVIDPLISSEPAKPEAKRRHTFGLLGKGFSSMEKRKKLERSVSTPLPKLCGKGNGKEKEKSAPPASDGEGEVVRRERKGPVAAPERRKTMPPEMLESMTEEEPEDGARVHRARSVDRCLKAKIRSPSQPAAPKLPSPPPRTNPYEAPYFFPQPGSPEAQDYVRRVREDRMRASKASNSSLRSYFHSHQPPPPTSPSSMLQPLPTPPGSGAASPRKSGGRLPPTPEEVGEALAAVPGTARGRGILKRSKTGS
ncbi:hypothetical protein GLOTRDRAFT_135019 [Gloeophyllum trabeum ATCC 11539]|uniref:Uncharacterized protein n=1 Tax=Gloeophyllum trabeum (strain ATCC 11539 / FP-39264 / Madison 617) TaxID=670483 RepID=S7RZ84_GLOTA|nr:uncharacterized protein GLOTRDRAFT_135019 [Gloeophyllum trabeum ATCC 11539]EPQ60305.1 hypothetical protein GLOTRDRAFT_135019 [Gloeophyllum trabeum ATCC 11539]